MDLDRELIKMMPAILIVTLLFVVIMLSMLYGQFSLGGFSAAPRGPILGRGPSIGRGVQPGTAAGGQPTRGIAYRSYEGDVAAVDTLTNLVAFGGNAVSTQVPKGAAVLDSMDIGASFDLGAAVVSVRCHVQVQLVGQGFKNSPHQFGGPAMSAQGVTSGLAISAPSNVRYENLNISTVEGGDASIQAVLIGEDPGDSTICVTLGYLLA